MKTVITMTRGFKQSLVSLCKQFISIVEMSGQTLTQTLCTFRFHRYLSQPVCRSRDLVVLLVW